MWNSSLHTKSTLSSLSLSQVALLSGAPGLGKTTLAHIAARAAGYVPVEVNASDDRSAAVFAKRIDTATTQRAEIASYFITTSSRSVRDEEAQAVNEKPICLILDEIDGAPSVCLKFTCTSRNNFYNDTNSCYIVCFISCFYVNSKASNRCAREPSNGRRRQWK